MIPFHRHPKYANMHPARDLRPGSRPEGDTLGVWSIDLVLPPHDGKVVFEDLPPVAAAIEEAKTLQEGNEVSAFDDEELGVQAVEILDKFASFEIEIVDDTKRYRQIDVSNTRSLATIDGDRALLPLRVKGGWQHISIDLERTVRVAFGAGYLTTCRVTLRSSLWAAKLFFQDEPYSDFELPEHLRAVG